MAITSTSCIACGSKVVDDFMLPVFRLAGENRQQYNLVLPFTLRFAFAFYLLPFTFASLDARQRQDLPHPPRRQLGVAQQPGLVGQGE
jgi:hypothetical protein